MDQAVRKLPQDLSTYLKDKGPTSSQQLATLADAYVDNRGWVFILVTKSIQTQVATE